LDFGGFEEFLEGVAAGDEAVAVGGDFIVGFLAGDEGGDEEGAAGVLPGVDEGIDAFGGVFDDVEDEAEVDDVCGVLGGVRGVDGVPAVGLVAEFCDGEDIAAVAAAVVEEGFSAAELAEFEEGFEGFGDFAADEGGFVSVDFLSGRGGFFRRGWGGGWDEVVAFEGEVFGGEGAFPVDAEADARGVFEQPGGFFLAGEFGEFGVEWVSGRDEGFLAVEDGWVGALAVIVAADFSGDEVDDDGFGEGWVGEFFEVGIGEEGDLGGGGVEFEEVEVGVDFEAFAEFGYGDVEEVGKGWGRGGESPGSNR